jgi:uncharacterized repeat protein (TIGR01451 family)
VIASDRSRFAAFVSFLLIAAGASAAVPRGAPPPRVEQRPDGVSVQVGPDWVSAPVQPERIFVDPRNRPRLPVWQPGDPIREIPRLYHGDPRVVAPDRAPLNPVAPGLDPLAELQRAVGGQRGATGGFTTPAVNVAGQTNTGVAPSDVNGDVGTTHFLQAINGGGGAQYAIYSKTTGALVAGPFNMEGLGTGGNCATGGGDPIVLFDELAQRWMISEFTGNSSPDLCIYLSQFADPSVPQTWTRYVFAPANSFPDYPHYGVWPDAYYVGTNQGNTTRPVCAMDRVRMLAGQAAQLKCFFPTTLSGFGFQVLQPADHDGAPAPPAGAPGVFMRHRDDEVHNASNDPTRDFVEYFEFRTNWTDTNLATLTGPILVPITEFDSDLNGLSAFEAFPQPNGQLLDPLREPVMFRLAYRHFGGHETLLANFVTDVDGNDTGGVRWVELRRTGGVANPWTLFQEGTYAPADGVDRWMGAVAMDSSGNIALGYSVVRQSPALFPGLRYVGRLDGDTAGVMTTAETTLIAGGGSQTNERWGDYFSMGVDPVDGCTFWFTGQYIPTSVWQTRIGAFRHDACGTPTFLLSGAPLQQSVCAVGPSTALTPVAVAVTPRNGFDQPVAFSFGAGLPAGFSGSYTASPVTPPGTTTANLSVNAGTVSTGTNFVTLRGSSGGEDKDLSLVVDVATIPAATPTLVAPADGAINQSYAPTLSWNAVAQASSYVVEVSTAADFATLAYTATVTGTSHVVATPLAPSTTHYWRVRAVNPCATSANSTVRSFTTLPPPDQCPVGRFAQQVFFDPIDAQGGWVTTPSGGNPARRWTLSSTRPFSPTQSWKGTDTNVVTNQLLDSPSIALPSGRNPVTLQFQHYRDLEEQGETACYDGGRLEISLNGGAYTPIPEAQILVDPYDGPVNSGFQNPLGGERAWCGLQAYTKAVVDLSPYAGNAVRVRYRLGTDNDIAVDGWYVDDVLVQACAPPGTTASTTALTSAPDPSVFGQGVTLTATVSGGSGTPTGTVAFFDGATSLGTATLNGSGVGTLGVASLAVGSRPLSATYSGNATYAASTGNDTQTVNKAATALAIADSPDPTNVGESVTVTATLTVTPPGAGTPTGTIAVTGTNTSGCTITLPATSCALSFSAVGAQTLDAGYSGDASFNAATAAQVAHTVSNTAPTVTSPGNQTVLEGGTSAVLDVTVADAETSAAALGLAASSSDQAIVPNGNVALGGSDATRTVQVTPATNAFGSATITLTVTDANSGTGTATFTVDVTPVNDAPRLQVLGDRTHPSGTSGLQTVVGFVTSVDFGPGEGAQAVLEYTVAQTGGVAGLVTSIDIANDGTLSYTLSGASGTATFDATVQDDGGTANGGVDTSAPVTFTITAADGADLSVTKTNGADGVVAGQPVSYAIVVTNDGPNAVVDANVADPGAAGLGSVAWTCTPTPPATCPSASGTDAIDELVDLAPGERLTYTLSAIVTGAVGTTVTNVATVEPPLGTPDPNLGDNSATDADAVVADALFSSGFED